MEQGSRGDLEKRNRYLLFRTTVLDYILKEKSLLFKVNWVQKIESYFQATQKVIEEIQKETIFNECQSPKTFDMLCIKNKLQQLVLFSNNFTIQEKIFKVIEIYQEIQKSVEINENKIGLLEELSPVLYGIISHSSWKTESFITEENKEIIEVINNQTIFNNIFFELNQNFAEQKGSVSCVLLEIAQVSPLLMANIAPFFQKISKLQVSHFFKNILEGIYFYLKLIWIY